MKASAGCLIVRTSADDLLTSLQILTQTIGRKLRSLAESFRFATGYLNLRYQTGCSNQPRSKHHFSVTKFVQKQYSRLSFCCIGLYAGRYAKEAISSFLCKAS